MLSATFNVLVHSGADLLPSRRISTLLTALVDFHRPYDARMWSALGGCYEKLDNKSEALKAYKRSLLSSDEYDMSAYERIFRICDAMGKKDLGVKYHYKAIEAAVSEKLEVDEYAPSLLAVAEYEIRHKRGPGANWELVERYLNVVMQTCSVPEVRLFQKDPKATKRDSADCLSPFFTFLTSLSLAFQITAQIESERVATGIGRGKIQRRHLRERRVIVQLTRKHGVSPQSTNVDQSLAWSLDSLRRLSSLVANMIWPERRANEVSWSVTAKG